MINEELLAKLEKLCASACEGPWRVSNIKDKKYFPDGVLSLRSKDDIEICGPIAKEDARFMATAREAVPALIAEVRRLEKEADLLAEELSKHECVMDRDCPYELGKRDVECIACFRKAAKRWANHD